MRIHKDFLHVLYNNIHEVLGTSYLDEERKERVLTMLAKRLENRIEEHLINIVPEPHRSRLIDFISDDAISHELKFSRIHNHIPNFLEFFEKEVNAFKQELVDNPDFD